MSDDGGNQPTVDKKEAKQEVTQTTEKVDNFDKGNKSAKTATIAELEGYVLKNVWPDQKNNVDIAKYKEIKKNYLVKAKRLGKKDAEYYWQNRVNLDAYEKLKKDKAISERWDAELLTTEEKTLLSQVIIIGKVVEREYDERYNARYKTTCKIEIEEIVTGKRFISENQKELFVKIEGDLRKSHRNYEPNLKTGKKYIFFLSKIGMERYASFNQGYEGLSPEVIKLKVHPMTDDVHNINVFANIAFSTMEYSSFEKHYNIVEIKAKMKKIEKTNNSFDFYLRKYK
ncbi:MAG: hypothetical protein KAH33_01535 [Candidatus Delongbacteria bacterium]|nr:hypothetical protein [Candidatus Delongbacteria bacterium]